MNTNVIQVYVLSDHVHILATTFLFTTQIVMVDHKINIDIIMRFHYYNIYLRTSHFQLKFGWESTVNNIYLTEIGFVWLKLGEIIRILIWWKENYTLYWIHSLQTCLMIADCASLATSGFVSPFSASVTVPSFESASIFSNEQLNFPPFIMNRFSELEAIFRQSWKKQHCDNPANITNKIRRIEF